MGVGYRTVGEVSLGEEEEAKVEERESRWKLSGLGLSTARRAPS